MCRPVRRITDRRDNRRRALRGGLSGEGGRLKVSGPDADPRKTGGRAPPRNALRPAILSVGLARNLQLSNRFLWPICLEMDYAVPPRVLRSVSLLRAWGLHCARRTPGAKGTLSTDLKERAADVLDASYASLFSELSGAFRARGLTTEEARDLAQESLVRTFVHLKRHGQTQPDLRPLAHTIAKRLYVERGRRARPQFVDLPQAEEIMDPAPQPADAVVAMEERRRVQAALRSLGPRHRRVISLWMGGLRPAEIARELGIKRNAADAVLHRARRQLAAKLDPSRATLGLLGLIVLRMRTGVRRVVDAVTSFDPAGSVAQAGAGLAVAGLAAVLLVSGATRGPVERVEPSDASTLAAEVAEETVTTAGTTTPPDTTPREASAAVPEELYRIGAGTEVQNPITGAPNDDFGVDLWYDSTPSDIAALDQILEPVVTTACAIGTHGCIDEGER